MTWDERVGSIHYIGPHHPIDMTSRPAIGDLVDLTKLGHEFHVEITAFAHISFTGIARLIGRDPAVEAAGVKRGETIMFNESNILALHRLGQ